MKPAQILIRLQNNVLVILLVVIFTGFMGLTIWGKDGVRDLLLLKARDEQIVQANQQLLRANWQLLQEIKSLGSPSYLEQLARQELGLVQAHEEIYQVE